MSGVVAAQACTRVCVCLLGGAGRDLASGARSQGGKEGLLQRACPRRTLSASGQTSKNWK